MKNLSIGEIQGLMKRRKSEVIKLQKRRSFYEKRLNQVIAKIDSISGGVVVRIRHKKRVKNETSLHVVVTQILSRTKKGYSLVDITNKVMETGYKSHSKNFRNVVYQCLYHMQNIQHDANTGLYSFSR